MGKRDFGPWFKSRKSLINFFLMDDGQKRVTNNRNRPNLVNFFPKKRDSFFRRSVNPAATQVGQKRGKIGVLSALRLHVAPIDPPVCTAQSPSTEHAGV